MGLGRGREAERIAHDDARFVLVRGGDGSVQAFAHFRFSANDEDYASRAVVYVWELQVAEPFQGAGLGRRVMGLLQRVAEGFQLDCVMLTVFKSNARALAFYMDKLGYAVAEADPIILAIAAVVCRARVAHSLTACDHVGLVAAGLCRAI